MPKVVPPSPIAYAVASDTLVIHREDGARWHVQCDRFAAQVAGEEEGLFERWAARLREHREEVEAARPRMDSGWLEGFLSRAFPHAKPIVDGVVGEWLFVADDDYIAATARIGRSRTGDEVPGLVLGTLEGKPVKARYL